VVLFRERLIFSTALVESTGAFKKLLALACEFFLRCLEARNPCCDFFPLPGDPLRLFGHAHPLLSRVSGALVAAIGARIGARRCGIVIANRVPASRGAFRAAVL
jgi:hypothetical protein